MNKNIPVIIAALTLDALSTYAQSHYIPPTGESYTVDAESGAVTAYGAKASDASSTAVHYQSDKIVGWATGYKNYVAGTDVAASWQTPDKALGEYVSSSNVCVLGNGGEITMTFENAICDGVGYDFAVFENSFSDTFLEIAYIEVSSDGVHFVRFPNVSLTSAAVGAFGNVDPTKIYNYGGKYKAGYGSGFDLAELEYAYQYMTSSDNMFSTEYTTDYLDNYQYIDINNIQYVKIKDIASGNSAETVADYDSYGNVIYDPYKTTGSGGFDLTGVAVLNAVPEPAEVGIAMGLAAICLAFLRRKRA